MIHGYSQAGFDIRVERGVYYETDVETIMLTDLREYLFGKVLMKVDIEGAENTIFFDQDSVELMKTFEYIAMELHFYAETAVGVVEVKEKTYAVLDELKQTHEVRHEHPFVYIKKRR